MPISWTKQHVGQLDWHWGTQLRPRLNGLTENSYRAGYDSFRYSVTGTDALAQLDALYAQRSQKVRSLGDDGLAQPGEFPGGPLSTVVLHINREVIHHGAEIALLRDLHRARLATS